MHFKGRQKKKKLSGPLVNVSLGSQTSQRSHQIPKQVEYHFQEKWKQTTVDILSYKRNIRLGANAFSLQASVVSSELRLSVGGFILVVIIS